MSLALSILSLLLAASNLSPLPAPDSPPGAVVAVGGGGIPAEIRARILALAGGADAPIVVIPFASERPEAGDEGVEAWREAGAAHAEVLVRETARAREQIAAARVLWLGGGDQNRLMETLRELDLLEAVRARHRAGAVIAGTSAGAAAMSRLMMTGEANLEAVHAGATELAEGLGAWPGAIVDQHFLARRRMNRLIAAVLDHPGEIGVGIDERTAAIFLAGAIEVVGDGQVMVIDARDACPAPTAAGSPHSAVGLRLHLLRAGIPAWTVPAAESATPAAASPAPAPAPVRRKSL